jgi:glutamate synthase (NADPH/NADH) large chain
MKLSQKVLAMLCNLEHRGAVGADPKAGDGSGLLIQIPHRFLKKKISSDFILPDVGYYAVLALFLCQKIKAIKKKLKN